MKAYKGLKYVLPVVAIMALVLALGSIGAIEAGTVGLICGSIQSLAGFVVFGIIMGAGDV